jgi:hypothetical protein
VGTLGQDDRYIVTASTPGVPRVCDAAAGLASPSAKSLVVPTVKLSVQPAEQGEHPDLDRAAHRIGEASDACDVTRRWFKRWQFLAIRRLKLLCTSMKGETHESYACVRELDPSGHVGGVGGFTKQGLAS